jgi:hypothetical protein
MGIYPYAGSRYDKYWKYENKDPSTNHYAAAVALEILSELQDKISKRGKSIYGVRDEAIIVQDLRHEVIRLLAKMLNEHVIEIGKYEQENSGDIQNYFGSVSEEQEESDGEGGRSTKNDFISFRAK